MEAAIEEKDNAVRTKADLEDDLDVALDEARYAAAVWFRDATVKYNESHGTTFAFFDGMFPALDDVPPMGRFSGCSSTKTAQLTNRPSYDSVTSLSSNFPLGVDEQQIDYGSE